MKLKRCFILWVLLVSTGLCAQDSLKTKKVKILPVPSFGYEPETKTYVGAVSLFTMDLYQDGLTRRSNAKLEFNYTWRKQSIIEAEWDYFFKEEAWFSKGRIHFSKYPDFYYGVGSETPETNETLYQSNRTIIDIGHFKNLGNKTFLGLGLRHFNYRNVSNDDSELLFDELRDTQTTGLRIDFFRDERNNLLTPTAGKYSLVELGYNWGTKSYAHLRADLRRYFSWKNNTVAMRFYNSFTLNTPAFYDYAILGGDDFVRGYFFGRFRDRHLSTFQAEYRSLLFWKIGVAVFGGLSTVYPDFSSITSRFRPNYGAGIRFLVDKEGNTFLRMDYALGNDNQSGFYISFGESF